MESEAVLVERWRSLLDRCNTVTCRLDRALQAEHHLSMSEFEALDRLVDTDCEKCRMQDLADAMYLSQSALSRTVGRLEKRGLVERTHCDVDRRGVFVRATEDGLRLRAQARGTQLRVLAENLSPASA